MWDDVYHPVFELMHKASNRTFKRKFNKKEKIMKWREDPENAEEEKADVCKAFRKYRVAEDALDKYGFVKFIRKVYVQNLRRHKIAVKYTKDEVDKMFSLLT